jgi:hypothetical protein
MTFGGTYGLMLGKRAWFNAGSKGIVQCWLEGDDLMLVKSGWFDAG